MPMDLIKRLLLFVVIGLIGVFIFQNQQYLGHPVEFMFFRLGYSMALGFWLVLGFLSGALVWFFLDIKRAYRLKRRIKEKDRHIEEIERHVSDLNGRITRLNGEIQALRSRPAETHQDDAARADEEEID